MDIEQFILEETLDVKKITPIILEEEEKKTLYWTIHDTSSSDTPFDEKHFDIETYTKSSIPFPKISDHPKSFSFKKYQEYCMKHGLNALDLQEEIDIFFAKKRIVKRWFLYFHYAPFSYLILFFLSILFIGG